jgi:hypothetical protein
MSIRTMSLLVGAVLFLAGCSRGGASPEGVPLGKDPSVKTKRQVPPGWNLVEEREGNFSAIFPVQAKRGTSVVHGSQIIAWTAMRDDGSVYAVASIQVTDEMGGPDGMLEDMERYTREYGLGMVRDGCGGQIEAVKKAKIAGLEGYVWMGKCPGGQQSTGFLHRKGMRLYATTILVQSQAALDDFETFMDGVEVGGG